MKRNVMHKFQSKLFSVWNRFMFLDYTQTDELVDKMIGSIARSGYPADVIVGISIGGDYPAGIACDIMEI